MRGCVSAYVCVCMQVYEYVCVRVFSQTVFSTVTIFLYSSDILKENKKMLFFFYCYASTGHF